MGKKIYFDLDKSKPESDSTCFCGKYNGDRYKGIFCDKCGVETQKIKMMRDKIRAIDTIILGLVEQGKKNGFISEDDIVDSLSLVNSYEILECLYEKLELEGVKVKNNS